MSIEALKEQARGHEQNEEWSEALQLYVEAINRQSDEDQPDLGLYNRSGDLSTRLGDLEGALGYYEQAVDLYLEAELPNNAIAILKKILRNMPMRSQVYLRMGQIRARQGFLTDARNNFLVYAEATQAAGELDEAFRALEEFADLAPGDVEVRLALADQLGAHDRNDEMLAQLARAHQTLTEREEADRAREIEQRIHEVDPDYVIPAPQDNAVDYGAFETTVLDDAATPDLDEVEAEHATALDSAELEDEDEISFTDISVDADEDDFEVESPLALDADAAEIGDGPGSDEADDDWSAEWSAGDDSGFEDAIVSVQDGEDASDTDIAPPEASLAEPPLAELSGQDEEGEFDTEVDPLEGALLEPTLSADEGEADDEWPELPDDLKVDGPLSADSDDAPQLSDEVSFEEPDEDFELGSPDLSFESAAEFDSEEAEDDDADLVEVADQSDLLMLDEGTSGETELDEDDDLEGSASSLSDGEDDDPAPDLPLIAFDDGGAGFDDGAMDEELTALETEPDTLVAVEAGEADLDDDDWQSAVLTDEATSEADEALDAAESDTDEDDLWSEVDPDGFAMADAAGGEDDADADEWIGLSDDTELDSGGDIGAVDPLPLVAPEPVAADAAQPEQMAASWDDATLDELRAASITPEFTAAGWERLGSLAVVEGANRESQEAFEAAHQAYAESGDFGSAMRCVRELLLADPDRVEVHQRLVEYTHRAGDRTLQVSAYVELADCLRRTDAEDKARAVFEKVLELDPGNRRATAALAEEPSSEEEAEPADEADYVDLGSMVIEPREKTTRWTVEAEEPVDEDDFDFRDMLAQFKAKVADNLDAGDVKAHYDLGTAYKEMGLTDEAIGEFQQALRADGGNLATLEMLGQCFLEKGQPEVAVRSLTRATEMPFEVEDELLGIYYYLGRAHEVLGNRDEASEYYEKVFALDINFQDVTERLRALR